MPVVSDSIRFSAVACAGGRPFSGAAVHQVATQSSLGQVAVGIGNYRRTDCDTPREIKVGLTANSGLFVDQRGDSLEERFMTWALCDSAVTCETWNDLINQKDYSPTFSTRVILDVLYLHDRFDGFS